jgi:hypothetical protein
LVINHIARAWFGLQPATRAYAQADRSRLLVWSTAVLEIIRDTPQAGGGRQRPISHPFAAGRFVVRVSTPLVGCILHPGCRSLGCSG